MNSPKTHWKEVFKMNNETLEAIEILEIALEYDLERKYLSKYKKKLTSHLVDSYALSEWLRNKYDFSMQFQNRFDIHQVYNDFVKWLNENIS